MEINDRRRSLDQVVYDDGLRPGELSRLRPAEIISAYRAGKLSR